MNEQRFWAAEEIAEVAHEEGIPTGPWTCVFLTRERLVENLRAWDRSYGEDS